MSPYILFHLYIIYTWTYSITKTLPQLPSITVLDKETALIPCKNVEIDLKSMQLFSKTVTHEAYTLLALDILFDLDLNLILELNCS